MFSPSLKEQNVGAYAMPVVHSAIAFSSFWGACTIEFSFPKSMI